MTNKDQIWALWFCTLLLLVILGIESVSMYSARARIREYERKLMQCK